MPNALLEAMYMGAFPIQSNPGGVTEEVITNGKNGYLISNPLDCDEIAQLIKKALANMPLRKSAEDYNVNMMENHFNRVKLQPKIVDLYQTVYIE
jgi:glycosyltransferase involved in cell wall biosynthesis